MSFLSSLLPTIAGAGLTAISGGAINPLTAGLIFGGLQTARTGSLQKGLMAGLGAYGGAGLGQGFSALGTSEAADVASNAVPDTGGWYDADVASNVRNQAIQTAREGAIKAAQATPFETMGKGISAAFNNPSKFMNTMPGKEMLQYGGAAAAPMMAAIAPAPQPQIKTDNTPADRMRYNVGRPTDTLGQTVTPMPDVPSYESGMGQNFGRQQNYFPYAGYETPVIGQKRFATGGMPVEEMSQANAVGANTGYPQADIQGHAYATPWQTPVSQNVVQGTADTGVNRMTGQMLADGGTAKAKDIGYEGYEPLKAEAYTGYGAPDPTSATTATTSSPSTGSPTGSVIGDLGYIVSNQPFSPVAALIAQAMMDNLSSTSPTSVDAINGLDAQSDAVSAGIAAGTISDGAPMGVSDNSDGTGTGGDSSSAAGDGAGDGAGEARGGLMPTRQYRMARGGISDAYYNLGSYSDGGRLLRGPGDGVSDSIPATIGNKQPARLADGEFVVPARIVSELGNGSTEAGARKLYGMMDRVQKARGKTVGKGRVAKNTRADRFLPA